MPKLLMQKQKITTLSHIEYIKYMSLCGFALSLAGYSSWGTRHFEILAADTLLLFQIDGCTPAPRFHVFPFSNGDYWSSECQFISAEDCIEKLNILQHDMSAYNRCLTNQRQLVKKYYTPHAIGKYIQLLLNIQNTQENVQINSLMQQLNPHLTLVYGICYYIGHPVEILRHHMEFLQTKPAKYNIHVVIVIMLDDMADSQKAVHMIKDYCVKYANVGKSIMTATVICRFNCGGTVYAFWELYKSIGGQFQKPFTLPYIVMFESDFVPINWSFVSHSIELMAMKDTVYANMADANTADANTADANIADANTADANTADAKTACAKIPYFIGECLIDRFIESNYPYEGGLNVRSDRCANYKQSDGSWRTEPCFKLVKQLFDQELEVWSDGGYYFSSIDRLSALESKIGIFFKGDLSTKYDHFLDGICYGEVGFPSLLFQLGLSFKTLNRNLHFKHYGNDGYKYDN